MKLTKIIMAGAILSTTMVMAADKVEDTGFAQMKAKCTKVVADTLECMNKATKPMEVRVCKMTQKKDFLDLKIEMMKSGKMEKMHNKMKGMGKGKCGQGKCGGAK